MLLITLTCHISYLYVHAPTLKEKSFAAEMIYEHCQFHLDVLMRIKTGTRQSRKHQRAICDALLQGRYELQECSASMDNEALFTFLK